MMRSGPQISLAVTMRVPQPKTDTLVMLISLRNLQNAQELAPNRDLYHLPKQILQELTFPQAPHCTNTAP